jgi:hypothetical protein
MASSTIRRALVAAAILALVVPATGASAATKVAYTSKTVVVDAATVKKNLIGVSTDGKTFKFKRAAGALAKLTAGKVMLLKGTDAVIVTKVSRSKGNLLVATKAATLPDVVKSADIDFKGPVNFQKAFLVRTAATSNGHAAQQFVAPGYPYVGRPPAMTAAGPTLSIQGSQGPMGFSLGFTPASQSRIDIAGTLCFQRGAVCSAGPANGLSAEVNLSGFIQAGDTNVGMTIDGGSVTNSNISIKNLNASLKMTYTIARGQGDAENSPPVFRVPVAVDYTIPIDGIPLYFKLQTALLLKLGVSSKNAVIRGGAQVTTAGGSEQINQSGKKVDAGGTGNQADATILGNDNGGGSSISLAPSGTVVAVQFPRLGAGLGVRSANGIGYIDMVTSVGQTTGSALAGMFCSNYDLFLTLGAGVEAQLGPIVVGSPKKTLFEKSFQRTEPGCPRS